MCYPVWEDSFAANYKKVEQEVAAAAGFLSHCLSGPHI